MRTDLSSIKEADSSVNGVVAYCILLYLALRCNIHHQQNAVAIFHFSGEINIKCMHVQGNDLRRHCTSLNLVIAKMSVISYPALHALCFIVIFSYLAYLHVYYRCEGTIASVLMRRHHSYKV